ncbi:hypothetical protein LH490_27725, partial [Klebsiella pneumoniae]|nr:hypothetical protein [Klebsiella pneumoniae]
MGVLLKPLRVKKRHHSRKKKRKQTDSRDQTGNVRMQAGENMFFMPWIGPYISIHFLSLNPLLVRRRRYSRGERYPSAL